jgi:hypothetical protein
MKERTPEAWQQHLDNTHTCGTYFYKFIEKDNPTNPKNLEDRNYKFMPILCKSNACPTCSKLRSKETLSKLRRVSQVNKFRFFTLTTINSYDTKNDLLFIEKCWRKLIKKLQLSYPDIKFFRIIELGHKNKMVHIHGLWNIYIDFIELSKLWQSISGAFRVNVKSVFNQDGAIEYLGKYLVKTFNNQEENELFFILKKRKFSYSKNLLSKDKPVQLYTIYSFTTYHKDKLINEIRIMIHDLGIKKENIIVDNLLFDSASIEKFSLPPPINPNSYNFSSSLPW